jgi:anti-sigma B factor antagonist
VTAIPEPRVSWAGRHAVVRMPAEIDVLSSASVSDQLSAVAAQRPDAITVDMTGTAYCDSAGIRALTSARQLTAERGGQLRLAVGDSPVARILQLTGLDQVLPLYRDVEQSLAIPLDRT